MLRERASFASLLACVAALACDPSSLDGFDLRRPSPSAPHVEAGVREAGNDDVAPVPPDSSVGPGDSGVIVGPPRDSGTAPVPPHDSGTVIVRDSGTHVEAGDGCPEPTTPVDTAPVVLEAQELGAQGRPDNVAVRDGAASALIKGKPLWLYHETRFVSPSSDGASQRTCTAAMGDATALEVTEPVDATKSPGPLLTLAPDEETFLDGTQNARGVLWPNTAVYDDVKGDALIFYLKVGYLGYISYDTLGVGVARAAPGKTTAARDPGLLFNCDKGDPAFHAGGIVDDEGYLYLYGCNRKLDKIPCYLARAPKNQWATRAGYTFWNETTKTWSTVVKDGTPLFTGPVSEMSVSWNRYLRRYIAVYTGPYFVPVMRTAPKPEGPWSEEVVLFQTIDAENSYGAKEHPEYASGCGKKIVVTYSHNTSATKNEIRVVEVTFR